MFLDAHLHLQDIRDKSALSLILEAAPRRSARRFFCNAVSFEDWPEIHELSKGYPEVIPFFGIHPWDAEQAGKGWEASLESYLERPDAGVGEIGLDKARKEISFSKQIEVFTKQLEISERLSKPFALHCVRAWTEMLGIFRRDPVRGVRFMIHSFRGPSEILRECLNLGAYVSFSWKVIRHQTEETMGLIRAVPLERLLLETDFPYTEPGKVGEDISAEKYFACLHETYAIAARAKEIEEARLRKAVWDNGTVFLRGTPSREG